MAVNNKKVKPGYKAAQKKENKKRQNASKKFYHAPVKKNEAPSTKPKKKVKKSTPKPAANKSVKKDEPKAKPKTTTPAAENKEKTAPKEEPTKKTEPKGSPLKGKAENITPEPADDKPKQAEKAK